MKTKISIAAKMALNAIEEHLLGADIDFYDVARVLREALDVRDEKYIDKNTIYVNEKELLCDAYIVICGNKGSNELEILGNVRGKKMAVMIMPLVDLVLSEL